MKSIIFITMLFSSLSFAEVVSPLEMKYHAHHTKFSCKSFRDQAASPVVLNDLEMKFSHLGVDVNMENAVISLVSTTDKACEYRAHYSIDPVADRLTFIDSSIEGEGNCLDKEADLDGIFTEGFRYAEKYYYYFALKFEAKFSNVCENKTGNFLVEFELGK